jgi:hypothetical protein
MGRMPHSVQQQATIERSVWGSPHRLNPPYLAGPLRHACVESRLAQGSSEDLAQHFKHPLDQR